MNYTHNNCQTMNYYIFLRLNMNTSDMQNIIIELGDYLIYTYRNNKIKSVLTWYEFQYYNN